MTFSSFCRRASLWSELYSEHPDNKKGIIKIPKISDYRISNDSILYGRMWWCDDMNIAIFVDDSRHRF